MMRRTKRWLPGVLLFAAGVSSPASADVVSERWGTRATSRHKTVVFVPGPGGTTIIRFDLSALPVGTTVYRASLRVAAAGTPDEPVLIHALGDGGAAEPATSAGEPLRVDEPWCRSFDVTSAVGGRLKAGDRTLSLWVKRLQDWRRNETELEIAYEGRAGDLPPQATHLKVRHHNGRTFVTWTEIDRLISDERVRWEDYAPAAKKGSPWM